MVHLHGVIIKCQEQIEINALFNKEIKLMNGVSFLKVFKLQSTSMVESSH